MESSTATNSSFPAKLLLETQVQQITIKDFAVQAEMVAVGTSLDVGNIPWMFYDCLCFVFQGSSDYLNWNTSVPSSLKPLPTARIWFSHIIKSACLGSTASWDSALDQNMLRTPLNCGGVLHRLQRVVHWFWVCHRYFESVTVVLNLSQNSNDCLKMTATVTEIFTVVPF